MGGGQWDVLIYHDESQHAELLVGKLKDIFKTLEPDVGEEVKVASTVEHFSHGVKFDSMEDALQRCTWMFILITDELLRSPMDMFSNNHALTRSIEDKGSSKYVPVFENKDKKATMNVPSYIKVLHAVCISGLETSSLQRDRVVNNIKAKLIDRKKRERRENAIVRQAQEFERRVSDIKTEFEKKKCLLQGAVDVRDLRLKCTSEIQQLARDNNITHIVDFLSRHEIDVSFATDDTSSLKWCDSTSLSLSHSEDHSLFGVDTACASGEQTAVEHDDAVEHDEMEADADDLPPPYQTKSTYPARSAQSGSPIAMEELKAGPLTQNPDDVDGGATLVVPPCPNELEPPLLLPKVLDDMHSTTSFSSVPRLSGLAHREQDVSSTIAECSESVQDATSLLGSQSHANLAEFDEEAMSQFSRSDSDDSHYNEQEEMDMGDHPSDLSMLEVGTGQRPLPLDQLSLTCNREGDDESMIVEVDSTVGAEDPETPAAVAREPPISREPPLRVMHRSYCPDDDDFDMIQPLEIDTGVVEDAGREFASPVSPGLGELIAHSWPRNRRGSDAGCRRPRQTNLTSNRFLSLSSLQSFSSRLFKLHHQPSLNNISEWGEKPQRLDGIRLRYS